eukprot:6784699-Alexandrium_andersonii.AAC.1
MRKSQMCACGCVGWCSVYPVMAFLEWGLKAVTSGRMPSTRHNGTPFNAGDDADRAARAGSPCIKAALVHLKGDWMEFCHTLALPMWNSVLN